MSQKADGRRPLNAGPAVEKGICREAAGHAKALKLIAPPRKERNLSGPTPRGATDRDGEKIDVHGKLKVKIKFGDTTYQHAVYVADIADPFILGLDFLKEHGFTLDFNKNAVRSIHEEVTIFKIEHRTESIRQVTANENITTPRTEIIVPGYIGNDVSFNSGLIGTAENKANGLLIASTLVDLSRKTIPKSSAERLFQEFEDVFSRNSSDIGHTTVTQHRIDTADHPPIKQHPRRLPFAKQEEVGTLLREMQENDIIEPSSSPWASQSSWFKVSDKVPYRFVTTSSPILIYPQPDKPFILDTDASNESVGAVLSQEINGQERVVAYWSQVARWIQRLNEYYFDIRHRKGSSHGNADALSRRPCPENCRHCSRVETKYDYAIRQITTSTATPPDPWSDEKVREDQMADPDIKPLIEFMESSSNKPSWQDISAYSPTTKQYWALWNSLHLRNGVLYRKFESEDGKTFRWQLVLPRSRIPEVLKELHGSPTGGHFGVMKTLHRVRERFCWGKVSQRGTVVQVL
ncbi:retrovirus-related Pol polyprotein from transposon 412 [Trichonephila clavipes]|nr:retrovirus-related Pol polyprotein from transposon 412 [Trichonephila clavipes]